MNYQLYIRNYSRNTNYEIVATVDGLDVLNGKQGSLNNNGYIVNAGDSLAIKDSAKINIPKRLFSSPTLLIPTQPIRRKAMCIIPV